MNSTNNRSPCGHMAGRRVRGAGAAMMVAASALLGGCTGVKRAFIRAEFHDTFAATMTPGTALTKLGEGFYTYRWTVYRTAFLATSEGVIVFDPLNDEAAAGLAEAIRRVAPNPTIKYVIYSHFHRDHASGARSLPGNPVLLAHESAAKDIAAHHFDDVRPPTETFAGDEYDLTLGGVTVRLLHLPKSHTDGLIMIHIPSLRTLYEVDVVWPRQLPPPGAPDMSYAGIRAATERMLALDFDTLVPGHGDVATKADVAAYHAFLVDLEAAFRAALRAHGMGDLHRHQTFEKAPDELANVFFDVEDALRPKYGRWVNFDKGILPTTQWCFWGVLIGL